MIEKIYHEWNQQWKKGPGRDPSSLFIAVSGGADSMALLRTAIHYRQDLTVLHLNHKLRGQASDGDEAFVADWCRRQDVPFLSRSVDVAQMAEEMGISVEMAGRKARYDFFEACMIGAEKPPVLLTAHHLDDQAETVLLHLLRGSGPTGAAGIRPFSSRPFTSVGPWDSYRIFRPFLGLTKADLLAFLEEVGESFREDASNREADFLRNRIRLDILPAIESKVNPKARQALARFAHLLQGEEAYLQQESQEALEEMVYPQGEEDLAELDRLYLEGDREEWVFRRNSLLFGGVSLRRKDLLALDPALARRVIKNVLVDSNLGEPPDNEFSFQDIEQIFDLAQGPTSKWARLCGIIVLCNFYGLSFFSDRFFAEEAGDLKDPELDLPSGSEALVLAWNYPNGHIHIRLRPDLPPEDRLVNPRFAYFPAHALNDLRLGTGQGNDPFMKFGGGQKSLRKIFNEWKVPPFLRKFYPLLWEGEKIVWIPWAGRSGVAPLEGQGPVIEMEWRPKWTKI